MSRASVDRHRPVNPSVMVQRQAEDRRLGELVSVSGPARRLLRAYADLLLASDPLRGRSLDGTGRQDEFDRPLPHQPTAAARGMQHRLERAMEDLADAAEGFFDPDASIGVRVPDVCNACGSSRAPRSKIRAARDWLNETLAGGPVEVSRLEAMAKRAQVARRTLQRAAEQRPRIVKFQEHGRWWWQLPNTEEPSK